MRDKRDAPELVGRIPDDSVYQVCNFDALTFNFLLVNRGAGFVEPFRVNEFF